MKKKRPRAISVEPHDEIRLPVPRVLTIESFAETRAALLSIRADCERGKLAADAALRNLTARARRANLVAADARRANEGLTG